MSGGSDHSLRNSLWAGLAFFAATRVLVMAVAFAVAGDQPLPGSHGWHSPIPTMRWDAGHYLYIFMHGYPPLVDGALPRPPASEVAAFLPGYPLAARPLGRWMSPDAALVTVTHVAALVGMVFLYLWSRRHGGQRAAFWCVVLLSAYPPAMYFSTGYADGLFFALVALALWLLDRGRPFWSALACGLASATRPTGLAVAAVLAVWVLVQGPTGRWGRRLVRAAVVGAIAVSGFVAYQLYLWAHYDRPDAFFAVQESWTPPQGPEPPLLWLVTLKPVTQPLSKPVKYLARGVYYLVTLDGTRAREQLGALIVPPTWNAWWNVILLTAGIVGLIRPGKIPRLLFLLPILIFMEAWLPDPYRGGRLIGIARYQLAALPSFLLLATWMVSWRRPASRYAAIATLLVMQCLYVRYFVNIGLSS